MKYLVLLALVLVVGCAPSVAVRDGMTQLAQNTADLDDALAPDSGIPIEKSRALAKKTRRLAAAEAVAMGVPTSTAN